MAGKLGTELVLIDINLLVPADWNYKKDDGDMNKLKASILEDSSMGVCAVRELTTGANAGKYEVIDGNHRLRAVREIGWTQVPCENFGKITKAKAVTIARRRNYPWFSDDLQALGVLLKNDVLPETTIEDLAKFMPDSEAEIKSLLELADYTFDKTPKANPLDDSHEDEDFVELKLVVPKSVYEQWEKWAERCRRILGYKSQMKAFEFAVIEALNVPEESLKK